MTDTPPQIVVRNVDPVLWRRVRAEAVRHDLTAGALLNEIMRTWLEAHDCESVMATLQKPDTRAV